jgi:hypothetical protein
VLGSGCIDPRILDLGTSWRWGISFRPQPHYPRGKSLRYPLDRRLGKSQNRYGRREEEKILVPTGTQTPNPRPCSPYQVGIATALSRLLEICSRAWIEWRLALTSLTELSVRYSAFSAGQCSCQIDYVMLLPRHLVLYLSKSRRRTLFDITLVTDAML